MSKVELRKNIKQIIREIDLNIRQHADEEICSSLTKILERFVSANQAILIGVYSPFKDEVCWFSGGHIEHWNLALPADYDPGPMVYKVAKWDALGPLLEKNAQVVVPDILVIPGLGYTREGYRLGRGGGHYDRYLEHYKGKKIGLCYEKVILKEMIIEGHDVAVDLVITEKNIWGNLDRFSL